MIRRQQKKHTKNCLMQDILCGKAKEKIGVVVLTEIYDVMKENQSYDEKRYTNALAEMVQHSIDFEDTHKIITECQ
mgnify:CR=1 FL=1